LKGNLQRGFANIYVQSCTS